MVYLLCDVKCIYACEYRCFHLFSEHSHLVGKESFRKTILRTSANRWKFSGVGLHFSLNEERWEKWSAHNGGGRFYYYFFPSGFIIRLFCSCSTLYSVILHFWLDNSTDHFIITMYQAHIRRFDFYAIDVTTNYFEILMVKLSIFHMFSFSIIESIFFRIFIGPHCMRLFLLGFSIGFFRKSFSKIILYVALISNHHRNKRREI